MIPFDEKGFETAAKTVLKPWLEEHVQGGTFSSFDGTNIQYYSAVRDDAKAVIVMLHGFCEFFGKFHETAYNFWDSGYSVFFMEQRGHGGSGRTVEDPDLVDVRDFSEYVDDLKCFLDDVVLPASEGNLLLYAHSMGGCVSTLFLEKHPYYFKAAALSSPMLKMNFGSTPAWQVKLLSLVSRLPWQRKKPMPGMQRFDPEKPCFEESGSSSLPRFMYQFDIRRDPSTGGIYTMNGGTLGWGAAAVRACGEVIKQEEMIRIPLLICQAGKDVYVDNAGQDELARRAKTTRLVRFPEAEHEIYASDPKTLEKYYGELLRFFGKASGL